jgi:hypothetical protein
MDSSLIELLNGAGLSDLTGGRGAPHFFIARMMAENKKKHKGQYRYSTTLPYGSKMNAPVVFEYKKLANQEQTPIGENPREYGASPFITKHFGTDKAVPFVPKRPPKPPYEEPPPRPERKFNPKWWSGYDKRDAFTLEKAFRQKKKDKKAKLDARIAREIEQGIRDPLFPVPERVEEKYEGYFPPARASSSSSSTPMGAVVPEAPIIKKAEAERDKRPITKSSEEAKARIKEDLAQLRKEQRAKEAEEKAEASSSDDNQKKREAFNEVRPFLKVTGDQVERMYAELTLPQFERAMNFLKKTQSRPTEQGMEGLMSFFKKPKEEEAEATRARNEEIRERKARNEEIRADKALKERRNEIKEEIRRETERIRELNIAKETASKEERASIKEEGLAINDLLRALRQEKDEIDAKRGK